MSRRSSRAKHEERLRITFFVGTCLNTASTHWREYMMASPCSVGTRDPTKALRAASKASLDLASSGPGLGGSMKSVTRSAGDRCTARL